MTGSDETLAETLAQAIEERRTDLSVLTQRLDDKVDEWDTRFADTLSLLRGLDVDNLLRAEAELAEATRAAESAERVSMSEGERAQRIRELVELSNRLEHSSARLPEVLRLVDDAKKELKRRERTLAERDAALRELLELKSRSKKTREDIQHWSALLKRRQTMLQKAEVEHSHDLSIAGIGSAEPAIVRRALRAADAELDDLTRRRSQIDQIEPALDLQRALSAPLDRAIGTGKGSNIIAYLPDALRVDELRAGVERRTHELADQPRPGEIEDLDRALSEVRRRIGALGRLPAAAQRRDRAKQLYDEAAAELAALAGRSGPAAEARLQNAQGAVATAQERVIAQRVQIDNLERERADLEALTAGDMRSRLESLERETGVRAIDAPVELASLDNRIQQVMLALSDAEAARRTAESRHQSLVARITQAAIEIRLDQSLEWTLPSWLRLREQYSGVVGTDADETKLNAAAHGQLAELIRPIAEMTSQLRNAVTAGAEFLSEIASQVRERGLGRSPAEPMRVLREGRQKAYDLVRLELERDFTELFELPFLRQELFGGAERVHLDLSKLMVRWTGADGGAHQRPLEAFSSGEQAFGYTLAKLEALAGRRRSKYVLLVLDEFGAFVARDRLTQLLSFVHRRALERIADQIVVILPLAQDYMHSGEPGPGDTRDFAVRTRQVRDREYFALPAEFLLV